MSPGQTIKSYILWTHPRGGLHYDVMVTVILAFIFLTPHGLFKDSPNYRRPRASETVVRPDGPSAFVYDLDATTVVPGNSDTQSALRQALEPVAGKVTITRFDELRDGTGKLTGYRVWAHR